MAGEFRIYLVRHGEAAASWGTSADPPLSGLGQQQAQAASDALLKQLGDAVPVLVSSPLSRARETAAPLAAALDLQVNIDERFREIPAPVPLAQRQDWLRTFMAQRWIEQPEAVCAWRDNLLQALAELSSESVVFTHFLVINAIVGELKARAETLVFWPANASVTVLAGNGSDLRLEQLGEELASRVN